jgi:septal ring factor EnvC (AmiA/AmiB activator)
MRRILDMRLYERGDAGMTKREALARLDEIAREIAELKEAIELDWANTHSKDRPRASLETSHERRERQADALLAELDAVAEGNEGRFDSADDIRQVRAERINRLAPLSENELAAVRAEVEKEFPFDPALQQVHMARKIISREADELGISYIEYVNQLAKEVQSMRKPS